MMEQNINNRFFLCCFFVLIACSSIVSFEPAPYDLLFICLIFIAFMKRYFILHHIHISLVICLLSFLLTNLLSMFFVHDFFIGTYYVIITIYCIISWLFFTSIGTYIGNSIMKTTFHAYVLASVIIVIPGIIAYLFPHPILDIFLWEGRMKGLFKDPNVFGPFLIPPTLFAIWRIGKRGQSANITLFWTFIFILLAVGIFLSFSRAAWGHFLLAAFIYFSLLHDRMTKKMRTIFIICFLFIPVMVYIAITTDVTDLFMNRLSMQHYDETRFEKQADSLSFMIRFPLGFGPGQSEHYLNHSTHNLFIRLLSENGLLGLLSFILFFIITIGRSVFLALNSPQMMKGFYVIVTACLVGMLFNSFFIDTIHWRHFWLLLALPWMHFKYNGR